MGVNTRVSIHCKPRSLSKPPIVMVRRRVLDPLPFWQQSAVLAACDEYNIKHMHAYHLWNQLRRNPSIAVWDDVDWTGLPKALQRVLRERFAVCTSTVSEMSQSTNSTTTKMILRLQDGLEVEAVIMFHDKRRTLCVSSECGCTMGCYFCSTGTMGILGDLWAGEILEQLYYANRITSIRNVVFMGMGEPLNNFEAVVQSIEAMWDTRLFCLSRKHVTVSTVGVVPRMYDLSRRLPNLQLALSLHAPTQELREQIMPSARAFPIEKLMDALDFHIVNSCSISSSGKVVMIEYIMLRDVNDKDEHAHQLGLLLSANDDRREKVLVNLIPYNPGTSADNYERSEYKQTHSFYKIMLTYGVQTFVRATMGDDIGGACGQLALKRGKNATVGGGATKDNSSPPDIEDIGIRKRSNAPSNAAKTRVISEKPSLKSNKGKGQYQRLMVWMSIFFIIALLLLLYSRANITPRGSGVLKSLFRTKMT